MQDVTWSAKEKQLARTVFERAAVEEERELLEHFRNKSAALGNLEDLWALQYEIRDAEREYQKKYDYRYSQLIVVFGRLVRECRISFEDLNGLGEDKLNDIKLLASL